MIYVPLIVMSRSELTEGRFKLDMKRMVLFVVEKVANNLDTLAFLENVSF